MNQPVRPREIVSLRCKRPAKQPQSASSHHPHPLLDKLLDDYELKNDAELGRKLKIAPLIISKIRHKRLGVSAEAIIRVHEAFDIPVKTIKEIVGTSGFTDVK